MTSEWWDNVNEWCLGNDKRSLNKVVKYVPLLKDGAILFFKT